MSDLKIREDKMKEKRKDTPFRQFIKELGSRQGLVFYKYDNFHSTYPQSKRIGSLTSSKAFYEHENLDVIAINPNDNIFDNMKKIFQFVTLPDRIQAGENPNSTYAESILGVKNAYLCFCCVYDCEDILYSFHVKDKSSTILNSVMVWDKSNVVYQSFGVIQSYKVFYSGYIYNCSDIRFSTNLMGCKECVFCDGLENQSYCIHNLQLSKEEYIEKKKEILNNKKDFFLYFTKLNAEGKNFASNDVKNGSFIVKSQNIENGLMVYNTKNGHNSILVGGNEGDENIFDCIVSGSPYSKNFYGVANSGNGENYYNSSVINTSFNIYYSYFCLDCSYCLGCVGLINKHFCIFNKQYHKEERFKVANEIFAKMEEEGTLGDFFPGSLSPFYFNDTAAYLIDDTFTKEEVEKEGYMRRDDEIKVDIPSGADVVETKDLPSREGFDEKGNRQINPDILKKVIRDEKGNYYRIVKMEYDFLMKHGLPLPELHWLERIKLGFKFK